MAVTVSASNTGTNSGSSHPNYTLSVSIPSPGSGASDDFIIVYAQCRHPRSEPVGNPDSPAITTLGSGGLAAFNELERSDTITTGMSSHSIFTKVWTGRRSAFTGGSITFTKGPVATSVGEMFAAVTTIVVDDPGFNTDSGTSAADNPGTIAPVGGVSDYCVAVAGDIYPPAITPTIAWSSGSFSTIATRANTSPSGWTHRLLVGDRASYAAATYTAPFAGFAVSFAFGDPPPAPTRGRRGLGLIRG